MKISIFCGGSGKRFWPLSRKSRPKQFLPLFDGRSTLQLAFDRVLPLCSPEDIFISTSFDYFEEIKRQLPRLLPRNLIGEPARRDLGPAVALNAAIIAQVSGGNEPFAIIWSDHLVRSEERFREMMRLAEKRIRSHEAEIVFLGCVPRYANENLGWIELEEPLEREGVSESGVRSFVYRPPREAAERYLKTGRYAWNLGYFVSTPTFILESFKRFRPGIYERVCQIAAFWNKSDYLKVLNEVYPEMEKISFDDAILGKINFNKACCLVADLGWADVGNPYAYKEVLVGRENLFLGDVLDRGSKDTLVYNDSRFLVATAGLSGVIVVVTDDAILVCGKDQSREVKKLVESLEAIGRSDLV